jgi:hypothetical protein
VKIPTPSPGLVVSYAYLWADEAEKGIEEGRKNRPCALILALQRDANHLEVVALPITHTPPTHPDAAYALPPLVKKHLGLDDAQSWVVLNEANSFIWPGPDLAPIAGHGDTCFYGLLPRGLFLSIRERFFALEATHRIRHVKRTE